MGATTLTAPAVAMANVRGGAPGGISIDERLHHLFAADPGARVHLYGKQVRPGRKIGHVTVLGDDMERRRIGPAAAVRWLTDDVLSPAESADVTDDVLSSAESADVTDDVPSSA